jgi:hypothetical protein
MEMLRPMRAFQPKMASLPQKVAPADGPKRGLLIEPHTHYRIIYKKFGRELHKFTRTKDFCQTV